MSAAEVYGTGVISQGAEVLSPICADHPYARARQLIDDQPPLVQLVSSCGLSGAYSHGVTCGVGGLFVLADKMHAVIGSHRDGADPASRLRIAKANGASSTVGSLPLARKSELAFGYA